MRAIVHKTKGKLDLRSLTVFGMNAKPETSTPIGYFGTGLKYAMAVLARHHIPVTFWIDRKQWVIERDPATFRGKEFTELFICSTTIGGLIRKRIKLPFTTELGKNWELWQAFRELESNTRDENGSTFLEEPYDYAFSSKGHTMISVEDERYVQCWMDRDKTFLPEGLSVRPDSNTRVQAFDRKSNHLYYRGIRIHDLKESSENTYNILTPLTLTEDRTLKWPWEAQNYIEQFLQDAPDTTTARAVRAPVKSYEGRFNYDYITVSDRFLDHGRAAGADAAPNVREKVRQLTPRIKETYTNWIRAFIGAIEREDWDAAREIGTGDHRDELLNILRTAAAERETEKHSTSQGEEACINT